MALLSERFSLQTRRDGVRRHRNAVLLEVMDEIYKLYSHKSSIDRHDIIDTIKKLKV